MIRLRVPRPVEDLHARVATIAGVNQAIVADGDAVRMATTLRGKLAVAGSGRAPLPEILPCR